MKKKNNPQQSIRQLMGITEITEYSLKTASSETVFFSIKPCNISILSEESLSGIPRPCRRLYFYYHSTYP